MRSHRRRAWIVLGAAALVAAALVALLGRSLGARRLRGASTAGSAPALAHPDLSTAARPVPTPTFPTGMPGLARSVEHDPEEVLTNPAMALALARDTIEEYRRLARYPDDSHPLEEGEDPILRDRTVSPVTAAGPEGAQPVLFVFPERAGFESPERAVVYAYLAVDGVPVPALSVEGALLTEALQPIKDLTFRDDGGGGDRVPGDNIHTAIYEPDPATAAELSVSYLVRVHAVTEDNEDRLAATSFQYAFPHAQLTGKYRERLENGGLVIEAEIEVGVAGRFHIEATLYSADRQHPIAWSQNAAELPPGRHWLALRYPGIVFHDKKVDGRNLDGPYVLRFVALSTATQMPNAKNRLAEDAHVTQPYTVAQFSAEPANNPLYVEGIRQIEREMADIEQEMQEAAP